MKSRKLLLLIPVLAIIALAWILAVTSMTSDPQEKDRLAQAELVTKADAFAEDKIYARAIPLYEQACGYKTDDTFDISYKLQTAYYDSGDYNSYYSLLTDRCGSYEYNVSDDEYISLAKYYFGTNDYDQGMAVLDKGISAGGGDVLKEVKESHQYDYYDASGYYTEMMITPSDFIPVKTDEKWSYINSYGGKLFKNILFDTATPFVDAFSYDGDVKMDNTVYCAMVTIDGVHQFIDKNGKRYSLCKDSISEVVGVQKSGYGLAVNSNGKYVFVDSEFRIISEEFNKIGVYSDGMSVYVSGSKYGGINKQFEEVLAPVYDGFALNDYGEAFNSGRAFALKSGKYSLIDYTGASISGESFDDARAFYRKSELAAVCKNGKWGFVDTNGNMVIDYTYDDATSFYNGLAAVCKGGKWGYINASNQVVIECQYDRAFPFTEKGCAQVLTFEGYKLIRLNWVNME